VTGNEQHWKFCVNYFFGGKYRFNFCNANHLNFVGTGEELNWQGTPYKAPDPAREGQYVTTLTWGDGQAFRFVEIMDDFFASLRYWELAFNCPDPGDWVLHLESVATRGR
jgi:hypothetical protein